MTEQNFRYISKKRRPKEDRRFLAGSGVFVADIVIPGMLHVGLVASPYSFARIKSINANAALALPGVHLVVTGEDIVAGTDPMMSGLDAPKLRRYVLADGVARYAGEWVAAVVADTRAIAEDAAELVEVEYEALTPVTDPEQAMSKDSPPLHPEHGSNILFQKKWVWGTVEEDFAAADHRIAFRARWHRSSTVPIETFGVVSQWNQAQQLLDVWASIQMPKFHDLLGRALRVPGNAIRVHYDVDVGGSYGVKRGLKHSILCGYLAKRLGVPVKLMEDRLENMRGGDAQGPDRIFDMQAAFSNDGIIRSLKIRALDDCGAHAGRAPLQLGKPVGAICGPYKVNSVEYEAISVTTNKTPQEAVRGFGQAPTNFALETMVDRVAAHLGMDRLEIRRRNLITADQFPYLIPSGSTYDSGDFHTVLDKTLTAATYTDLIKRRDAARAAGKLAGIGLSTCLEPSGGNSAFEPLFNPKNETTTWMEASTIKVDPFGAIVVIMNTSTSGQGHETLAATVAGEILERDPDTIRVLHADSLSAMPSNSPVGSRMAIMLGGATAGAGKKIKASVTAIGAKKLGVAIDAVEYRDGNVVLRSDPSKKVSWEVIVEIAHRKFHELPEGMEPGLQASFVLEVPTGGALPDASGRVQMYPCYAFESHIVYAEIDRVTGQVTLGPYTVGHDCGVMINPDIVHGMTYGGIAHGIGAALYERFLYDDTGQLLSGTFMDYLIPSSHEVPDVKIIDHCTPSPLTAFGQKGSGEAGYLGGPAAIACAVNDALSPLGLKIAELPMTPSVLGDLIATVENKRT